MTLSPTFTRPATAHSSKLNPTGRAPVFEQEEEQLTDKSVGPHEWNRMAELCLDLQPLKGKEADFLRNMMQQDYPPSVRQEDWLMAIADRPRKKSVAQDKPALTPQQQQALAAMWQQANPGYSANH
jgi:hypothetical protein